MGRHIPAALLEQIQQDATTMTLIMRVDPVSPGYPSYGVTLLDQDVTYDDGDGLLVYGAAVGMQPTAILFNADLSVDNAEATSLLPEYPEYEIPVSEADIRSGAYDFARARLMQLNFADTSMGHVTLWEGTIGQVSINSDGLSFVTELRGLAAQLKQSLCEKDSLTCRATFGSGAFGSGVETEERFPCGFDASGLWEEATVSAVTDEVTLAFTVAPFTMDADELSPGLVRFLTGENAGRTYEIDSNTSGGQLTLQFEADYPIGVGDTLEYRRDCNKQARDEDKGCRFFFGDDWVLHFRGEPDIPIGDAGQLEVPGASSSPGRGGVTYEPLDGDD